MKLSYKTILVALLMVFAIVGSIKAEERWVDVTSSYIKDASFNSASYSEWTVTGTANSITARVGCMEMWSGQFKMEKKIKLAPGKYRFTVNALYRVKNHNDAYQMHKDGTEDIAGFFFVGDKEEQLQSQYSFGFDSDPGAPCYFADGKYYPNSMEAAEMAFNKNEFLNEITAEYTTETEVSIGVYNDTSIGDNWLVCDNFCIEKMEDVVNPAAGNLVINELMPANVDFKMSPAYNFDSWIELYNTTGQALWLGGCYLSDDSENLTKWRIPDALGKISANGFKTMWLGSWEVTPNEPPFSLDCEGGGIYLSDPEGNLLASATYTEGRGRQSFARKTDGSEEWAWTAEPTPGASNATSSFYDTQMEKPVVTPDGGLFDSSVDITVTWPEGATLRYTTDGTTPTLKNGKTSTDGRFTATDYTSYRFRVFKEGTVPSEVVTRTYLKRQHDFTLPVICVSTDNNYLYDDSIGVYVKGVNGCTGNGQDTPANWNMEWDRPVNFQYILPETNTMAVNQDVDFAVSGGWTRSGDPKAFKLKADRVYEGLNAYSYPFFKEKPFNKNKTVQIRAGGNDSWCRIKDPALQTILREADLNLDVLCYQPAVVYLNGVYKGVMNVREPNNKDFAYANFGYSKDELDVYEQSPDSGAYMMQGTMDVLNRVYELSENATDPATYEEIKTMLDIDEYINYMAAELYLGSWDWPDNNVKAYRKKDNGKYRYVIFDLDAAFGTDDREFDENGNPLYKNTFRWIDGMQWHWYDYIYDEGRRRYGEIKFCTQFLNLLNNDDFRRRFIDAFCVMGGSVITPEKAEPILKRLGDVVRTTMSWDGMSPDGSLNEIRNALKGRLKDMTDDMIAYERLQLKDVAPQSMQLTSNNADARLFINDQVVPYNTFKGNLFAPVTFKAVTPAGYKFDGWKKTSTTVNSVIENGSSWKYYDQGSLDGKAWKNASYDDSAWASGNAPLGYGKSSVVTTLDFGGSNSNKRPTYYFRRSFNLDNVPTEDVSMNFTVDDGFVVYVNGVEGGRYHLAAGDINYETMASTADSNPDNGTVVLPASLFKAGNNVIAVEVHNNNLNSSDILWDANMSLTATTIADEYWSENAEVEMPEESSAALQACFSPLTEEERNKAGFTPVVVNEVSCQNSIYINDLGKRKDWVELYNTTDEPVDVEGMYLSDNEAKPTKYQISKDKGTASTIIPAHGYLIIWCDKEKTGEQLHASFKIDDLGGVIILTAKDKSWTNTLKYSAHGGDETVGRYPDGASSVYTLNVPTIAKSNIRTSYMETVEQPVVNSIESVSGNKADGMTMRYAAQSLNLRNVTPGKFTLTVYTVSGQLVMSESLSTTKGECVIGMSQLQRGCYVARVTDSKGRSASCHFLK